MLKTLSKLLGGTAGSSEIASALERAKQDIVTAEAASESADAAYRAGLIDETPAALRTLIDAKTDAGIAGDRARAVVARLEQKLQTALDAEANAKRQATYEKAKTLTQAASRKIVSDYPEAAEKIREVLRAIAEADLAVEEANQNLPDGMQPLPGPEQTRSTNTVWREPLPGKRVERWAGEGDFTRPIDDDLQSSVKPNQTRRRNNAGGSDEVGTVELSNGSFLDVIKKPFIRREVLPDVTGWEIADLAATVSLPPMLAGASSYWEPTLGGPEPVLAALDTPLRQRPPAPERTPVIEYALIREKP